MMRASKRALANSAFLSPVTDSSKRPTMPMTKEAVTSKETAKNNTGRNVSMDSRSQRKSRLHTEETVAHVILQEVQQHDFWVVVDGGISGVCCM